MRRSLRPGSPACRETTLRMHQATKVKFGPWIASAITRPDDWHLHLRDGPAMASVLADTARRFARAIVMPNLQPPVTTTQQALALPRAHPRPSCPQGSTFEPLMTLYLTDDTPPEEIARAKLSGTRARREALPGGRDHAFGRRRDAHLALLRGAGENGAARPAAADPRRGDRSGGGRVRPREGLRRRGARARSSSASAA